jgi:hypothetical protein
MPLRVRLFQLQSKSVSSDEGVLMMALRRFIHLFIVTTVVVFEAGNSIDVHPYLLFSTQQSIYKHVLNGTSSTTTQILTPPSVGIVGLSYHLRLGSLFFANGNRIRPAILTARIDGSAMTELFSENLGEPADLEVDWINDRLYWVDRSLRQIGEYDLVTGHRSVVLSTGVNSPSALALYPYPNYGWIYWIDGTNLKKASVTGDDISTLRSDLFCVNVLTIDYASVTIYWIDQCLYEIQSLRLDGDVTTHFFPFTTDIPFATGLVIKNGTFYWSEQGGVFERQSASDATVTTIYRLQRGFRATGLQLVHSTVQPQVDDFIEIIAPTNATLTFQCSAECVNGNCIPPGLCACSAGWRDRLCDVDVDECERQNGGCEHFCLNEVGSYHCACREGYTLADGHHLCNDIDECSVHGKGPCQQVCTNLPGTYLCSCHSGFILEEDGLNCMAAIHHTSVEPTAVMTQLLTPSSTEGAVDYSEDLTVEESAIYPQSTNTGSFSSSTISSTKNSSVLIYDPVTTATVHVPIATSSGPLPAGPSSSSTTEDSGVVSSPSEETRTSAMTTSPILLPTTSTVSTFNLPTTMTHESSRTSSSTSVGQGMSHPLEYTTAISQTASVAQPHVIHSSNPPAYSMLQPPYNNYRG